MCNLPECQPPLEFHSHQGKYKTGPYTPFLLLQDVGGTPTWPELQSLFLLPWLLLCDLTGQTRLHLIALLAKLLP